jgi:3-hydroxybutyryl-CoA dehydratase
MEIFIDTPPRRLSFADLKAGDEVFEKRCFTYETITAFSAITNDTAPVHNNHDYANTMGFNKIIVQGLLVTSPFSRLIGMYLPGERALLGKIEFKYNRPTYCNQELIYKARIEKMRPPLKIIQLSLCITSNGESHVTGNAQCYLRDLE